MKVTKEQLRIEMTAIRDQLSQEYINEHSERISERLWQMLKEQNCHVVHTYIPMGKEVNIAPFIKQCLDENIKVICPKVEGKRKLKHLVLHSFEQIESGPFGTSHPSEDDEYKGPLDLIVVPGLAFDVEGNRIGYGAGFYDYFLSDHKAALKIGVAYPFQVVELLETEAHDIPMDLVFY